MDTTQKLSDVLTREVTAGRMLIMQPIELLGTKFIVVPTGIGYGIRTVSGTTLAERSALIKQLFEAPASIPTLLHDPAFNNTYRQMEQAQNNVRINRAIQHEINCGRLDTKQSWIIENITVRITSDHSVELAGGTYDYNVVMQYFLKPYQHMTLVEMDTWMELEMLMIHAYHNCITKIDMPSPVTPGVSFKAEVIEQTPGKFYLVPDMDYTPCVELLHAAINHLRTEGYTKRILMGSVASRLRPFNNQWSGGGTDEILYEAIVKAIQKFPQFVAGLDTVYTMSDDPAIKVKIIRMGGKALLLPIDCPMGPVLVGLHKYIYGESTTEADIAPPAFPTPAEVRETVLNLGKSSVEIIVAKWLDILNDPTQATKSGKSIHFDLPVSGYSNADLKECCKLLADSGWTNISIIMGSVRVSC
jgi:hypothetical protein